jgi:hypothetical protein
LVFLIEAHGILCEVRAEYNTDFVSLQRANTAFSIGLPSTTRSHKLPFSFIYSYYDMLLRFSHTGVSKID